MKYTIKSGSNTNDLKVTNEFGKHLSGGLKNRSPLLIGSILFLINYFVGVAAFFSRVFLRIRLGERTYGISMVIMSFAFIYFLQISRYSLDSLSDVLSMEGEILPGLIVFFRALAEDPNGFFDIFVTGSVLKNNDLPLETIIFGVLFLGLSIFHFIESFQRRKREELYHSLYRGDSLYFHFLIGQRVGSITIQKIHVWMIVEPLFIFIAAWILDTGLKLEAIGFILQISAICLFIEEFRVHREQRLLFYDIQDRQLDGLYISSLQKEFEAKKVKSAQASFSETTEPNIGNKTSDTTSQSKTFYKAKIN